MNRITIEIDINGFGVPVEVGYNIFGKHYPATRTDPEEWPELEITKLTLCGADITAMLDHNGVYESIEEAVWDEINRNYDEEY